jgi:hypothetical protein
MSAQPHTLTTPIDRAPVRSADGAWKVQVTGTEMSPRIRVSAVAEMDSTVATSLVMSLSMAVDRICGEMRRRYVAIGGWDRRVTLPDWFLDAADPVRELQQVEVDLVAARRLINDLVRGAGVVLEELEREEHGVLMYARVSRDLDSMSADDIATVKAQMEHYARSLPRKAGAPPVTFWGETGGSCVASAEGAVPPRYAASGETCGVTIATDCLESLTFSQVEQVRRRAVRALKDVPKPKPPAWASIAPDPDDYDHEHHSEQTEVPVRYRQAVSVEATWDPAERSATVHLSSGHAPGDEDAKVDWTPMSAEQARELGELLIRTADMVEGRPSLTHVVVSTPQGKVAVIQEYAQALEDGDVERYEILPVAASVTDGLSDVELRTLWGEVAAAASAMSRTGVDPDAVTLWAVPGAKGAFVRTGPGEPPPGIVLEDEFATEWVFDLTAGTFAGLTGEQLSDLSDVAERAAMRIRRERAS